KKKRGSGGFIPQGFAVDFLPEGHHLLCGKQCMDHSCTKPGIAMKYFIFLLLMGMPVSLLAEETPAEDKTAQQREALGQVRDHLRGAMDALGKAGRLTYESQLPALQEKTDQALKETKRLMQELEQRLQPKPKQDDKPPPPNPHREDGLSSI
ncbi:MAG: hypothetical protein H7839_07480, partial [Magnetococcus sp. YQC-5]